MKRSGLLILCAFFLSWNANSFADSDKPTLRVGSKVFTEGGVLAEIIAQQTETIGEANAERKFGLGGTGIVYSALLAEEIDIYAEYTGTISRALLKRPDVISYEQLNAVLKSQNLTMSKPLGFNNTYGIAMPKSRAKALGIRSISDLRNHPELRYGFTHEFLRREDGFPILVRHYDLKPAAVAGFEHLTLYQALRSEQVDVIEVYTTDAKIQTHDLIVLQDDQEFFPKYLAVFLARMDAVKRFPKTWAALNELAGTFDEKTMVTLNRMIELDKRSYKEVAATFLSGEQQVAAATVSKYQELWKWTKDHAFLVTVSLFASLVVGLVLGIAAAKVSIIQQPTLAIIGLVQTIPALALLCFLIPFFGIGTIPALVALFLYALLPIVRNTYEGLSSIETKQIDVAKSLGLSPTQRLCLIELPLASPMILAGIKTSAVINVGGATLAALIGAGGYGEPILAGLYLNDVTMIFLGAVPAAVMALTAHVLFEMIGRLIIPQGLRI